MNTRRTTLLVAILLAVGTGWLTLNYITSVERANSAGSAATTVLVASSEIPARATITSAMLQRVTRPASAVEPDALSDPQRAVGALSLITIPVGGQITNSKIGHPTDVGLPVRLQPGFRAVSIAIDRVKGVSGLIQPGDRVDVIAIPARQNDAPPPAATILRGIRVLAIGTSLEYAQASPSPDQQNSQTVTLEVNPHQADLLAMADQNTTLRLALRSPREKLNSEPTEALRFPTTPAQAGPVVAAAPALAPADPRPQAPRVRRDSDVIIIDGDHLLGQTDSPQGRTEP
jgi:pilus assembly protein CpaB